MIRVVHPGSGSWFFTHPGFRIQGVIKAPDPRSRSRNTGHKLGFCSLITILPGHELRYGFGYCMRRNRRVRRALRCVRIRIYHLAVSGPSEHQTFLMRYQAFFKFTLELTINIGFIDPDQVRPDL
jgi:hypothetical protein